MIKNSDQLFRKNGIRFLEQGQTKRIGVLIGNILETNKNKRAQKLVIRAYNGMYTHFLKNL
jgi:hypothetical protein